MKYKKIQVRGLSEIEVKLLDKLAKSEKRSRDAYITNLLSNHIKENVKKVNQLEIS